MRVLPTFLVYAPVESFFRPLSDIICYNAYLDEVVVREMICENAQQSGVQVMSDVVIYCPLLYASNTDSLLVVSDAKIWINHALSGIYDEFPLWVYSVFLTFELSSLPLIEIVRVSYVILM